MMMTMNDDNDDDGSNWCYAVVVYVAMTWPLGSCLTMIYNETDHHHNERNMAVLILMIAQNCRTTIKTNQLKPKTQCNSCISDNYCYMLERTHVPRHPCLIKQRLNIHKFLANVPRNCLVWCHVIRIRRSTTTLLQVTTDVKCRDATNGTLVSCILKV